MGLRGPVPKPLIERFEPKVRFAESGCWEWEGGTNGIGYGKINVGGRAGRMEYAHRVSWELFVGPIPEGLSLDHLCRNPICVNPDHLEPVTHAENLFRARRQACRRGHPFTPENTGRQSGGRRCLTCHRERENRRRSGQTPDLTR